MKAEDRQQSSKLINKANVGCRVGGSCTAVFLYADDVILLAPSVDALQTLVNICLLYTSPSPRD